MESIISVFVSVLLPLHLPTSHLYKKKKNLSNNFGIKNVHENDLALADVLCEYLAILNISILVCLISFITRMEDSNTLI